MKALSVVVVTLVALTCINGCAPKYNYISRVYQETALDFSEYSAKGFLFTPNVYTADYESIGVVSISFYPEANLEVTTNIRTVGMGRSVSKVSKRWVVGHTPETSHFIDIMYKKCAAMGADALTQIEITYPTKTYTSADARTPTAVVSGIELSGFAIKRLGAFNRSTMPTESP